MCWEQVIYVQIFSSRTSYLFWFSSFVLTKKSSLWNSCVIMKECSFQITFSPYAFFIFIFNLLVINCELCFLNHWCLSLSEGIIFSLTSQTLFVVFQSEQNILSAISFAINIVFPFNLSLLLLIFVSALATVIMDLLDSVLSPLKSWRWNLFCSAL